MPQAGRVSEFARGWPPLLAASLGVGLGVTGLPFYSFGQFVRPLGATFHWSRGEISGGVFALEIGTVLVAPFVGRLIDRFGPRPVALLSQLGLVVGFLLVSMVGPNAWLFDAAWLVLALLGGGTSPIVWTRVVAGWFQRNRGLALGIMLCGTGVAAILSPLLVTAIVATLGWRDAYRVLAAVVLLLGMPVTYALLHGREGDTPKQAALLPGIAPAAALRSSQFWRLFIAFVLISIAVAGLIVHGAPLLLDRGATPGQAARTLSSLGYAIIVGRLTLGFLMDRLPPALVGGAFVLLATASSLLLASGIAPWVAILLMGLCAGAEVDLLAFLVSRLFGLRHYAQIYGWGISAFTAGAALGPLIAGMLHDRTGNYLLALDLFAAATAIAAGLIMSLGPSLTAAAALTGRAAEAEPAD